VGQPILVEDHAVGVERRCRPWIRFSRRTHTEECHHPGHLLGHVGEVLTAHSRRRKDAVALLAEGGSTHLGEPGGLGLVVVRDRVAVHELEVGCTAVGLSHPLDRPGHCLTDPRPRVLGDAADGSLEEGRLRNDVGRGTRHDMGNGENRRVEDVDPPGDCSLEGGDNRCRGRDRVSGVVGGRGVSTTPPDGDGYRGIAG